MTLCFSTPIVRGERLKRYYAKAGAKFGIAKLCANAVRTLLANDFALIKMKHEIDKRCFTLEDALFAKKLPIKSDHPHNKVMLSWMFRPYPTLLFSQGSGFFNVFAMCRLTSLSRMVRRLSYFFFPRAKPNESFTRA